MIKSQNIRVLCFFVLVVLLSSSSVATTASLSDEVEYYYNKTVQLDVSSTISFEPTDTETGSLDGNLINGSIVHTRTTLERGWVGALPLDKGYAIQNFSAAEKTVNLSITYTVDILPVDAVNLSIVLTTTQVGSNVMAIATYNLFDGQVSEGDQGNESRHISLVHSAFNADNGSLIPELSYLQILSSTTAYYYASVSAYFYTTDGTNWDNSASISLHIQGMHNPEFYDLMQQRIRGNESTTDETSTSNQSDNAISPYLLILPTLLIILVVYYYRKRS